jgi:hypothetical protein
MRLRRLPDIFAAMGVLVLAVAIGEGQHQSAQARGRRDPLLWQVRIFDAQGNLLRSRELVGAENEVLSLVDPTGYSPHLGLQLLPLGLPDGDIDLELHLTVNGGALPPLQGLRVTPGESVQLDVPGQPLKIELRATRGTAKRPLVS